MHREARAVRQRVDDDVRERDGGRRDQVREQQRLRRARRDGRHGAEGQGAQHAAERQVRLPPVAQERRRVGEEPVERLDDPRRRREPRERGEIRGREPELVLEVEVQREPREAEGALEEVAGHDEEDLRVQRQRRRPPVYGLHDV